MNLLDKLKVRIANALARAVVQLVDDGRKLQLLQLGVLDGEVVEEAERFQEYGFTSVPLEGAEAVVLFPNGDRGHPLVVAVDDRRHRLTGLQPGEVAVYNNTGARIRIKADGTVEVDDGSGAVALALKSDVDALRTHANSHTHAVPITGPAGSTVSAVAVPVAPPNVGTTVLKGK